MRIGNKFGNIQVNIGTRTDMPSSIVLPRSSVYAQHLSKNLGKEEITIPLQDTLLFHVGALSADSDSTKKSVLSSFTNLAHTWISLPGDTGRNLTQSLSRLRKKTSITSNTVKNLQYRKGRFFSVLFAMTHALMPTRKKVEQEQEFLYQNIFKHVLLSTEPEEHEGAIGNFMDENAFKEFTTLNYAETLHPKPSRDKRLKTLLLLRGDEKSLTESAMASSFAQYSGIPPIVLSIPEEVPIGKTVPILMNFPASDDDIQSARQWNKPLNLSDVMVQSLASFHDGFPFKYTFSLDEVLLSTSTGIVSDPGKDRPTQIPEEILGIPKRNVEELTRILITTFGIERGQIAEWFQDGTLDLSNEKQMSEIQDLANVVKRERQMASESLDQLQAEQVKVTSLKKNVSMLKNSLTKANEETNKSVSKVESLQARLDRNNNKLNTSEIKANELASKLSALEKEAKELRARGEKAPEDLTNKLRECRLDLMSTKRDLSASEKSQDKLLVLLAVLNNMATIENNSNLTNLIRYGTKGGLGDMCRYAKAFGFNPDEIPGQLHSASFVADHDANVAFDKADSFRPKYVLPADKVNAIKAQLERTSKIKAQLDQKGPKYSVGLKRSSLIINSSLGIKEEEEEEEEKILKKVTETLPETFSLARVLEKVDSRPGFSLNPEGKKHISFKKTVKRICLTNDIVLFPSKNVSETICGKGFCQSALFPKKNDQIDVSETMESLVNTRLNTFSGLKKLVGVEEEPTKEEPTVMKQVKKPYVSTSTNVSEKVPEVAFTYIVPSEAKQTKLPESPSVFYIDDYRDQEEQTKAMNNWYTGAEFDQPEGKEGSYEDGYFYYEVPEESGDGGEENYYYTEEYAGGECESDSIWTTQSSAIQVVDGARRPVFHYGQDNRQTSRLFASFIPKGNNPHNTKLKSPRHDSHVRQTSAFGDQARSAITMLVAGTLTIASTRISLQKHSGKRGKDNEKNTLILEQLTIPRKFDDSCRRANKESDTIPMTENVILEKWKLLLELSTYKEDKLVLSPKSEDKELLYLVRALSRAIETGNSKIAREAMIKLCDLASFSKNVRVTMINLVREMHSAMSWFRCTNNRNKMMDCVRRSNAIKI
ncbi:MAG: hypothetical protein ACTSUE_15905 [Promethearchaeota archaeon]